ncbi:MAG: phosphatase domain-containing protein [Candidatus Binatia bacterium]
MLLHRRSARVASVPPVIFRWDLDKTYLQSDFESLRELMRIPFEKPEEKVTVPGVAPLIRGLREVAVHAGRDVRIYFISASPPQIATAVKEKLALDGIQYEGIVFKNQLQHLMRGRFRHLREQVGFKLTELLKSRVAMPPESEEILFGDDWESDPVIYSLYADVVARRLTPSELGEVLATIGVDWRLNAQARELAMAVPAGDVVRRIYINLERRTPPTTFRFFGARLVPAYNYFQTAACLFEDGHLTLPAVSRVAECLIGNSGYTPARLANSLADIVRRGHLGRPSATAVCGYLCARGVLPRRGVAGVRPPWWQRLIRWPTRKRSPAPVQPIDYRTLVTEWRAAR